MAIRSAYYPNNLLSHDDDPDWKVQRFPFTAVGGNTLANMKAGFLVKFDATAQAVLPAVSGGADDALLGGIIVDLNLDQANVLADGVTPADNTVLVAMEGSFDKNQIYYADQFANLPPNPGPPVALTAAAINRLRTLNIFLDPAVIAGPFSP